MRLDDAWMEVQVQRSYVKVLLYEKIITMLYLKEISNMK